MGRLPRRNLGAGVYHIYICQVFKILRDGCEKKM